MRPGEGKGHLGPVTFEEARQVSYLVLVLDGGESVGRDDDALVTNKSPSSPAASDGSRAEGLRFWVDSWTARDVADRRRPPAHLRHGLIGLPRRSQLPFVGLSSRG
jgi:hypothetical protein